jgi:hypothetical protein
MGKGSLGTLLDLGSKRNLGILNLAGLPDLYAFQDISTKNYQGTPVDVESCFYCFDDLLVWYQLPAFSTKQCACIFPVDKIKKLTCTKSIRLVHFILK